MWHRLMMFWHLWRIRCCLEREDDLLKVRRAHLSRYQSHRSHLGWQQNMTMPLRWQTRQRKAFQ
jgi:hypothetical protein